MWACLQRCLTFEDPASKWQRFDGLIRKQATEQNAKNREPAALTFSEQDWLFASIFGLSREQVADTDFADAAIMVNVMIALADVERFTDIAFDSWNVALPADGPKEPRRFSEHPADAAIVELAKKLNLTYAQQLWLRHSIRSSPDWTVLLKSGPWTGDARADFVAQQVRRFKPLKLDTAGFLQAKQMFDATLKSERPELPGGFLPDLLLLVEGETEMILLPHFAYLLGRDFSALGVMVVSAGGGKQVARRYFEMRDVVSLPIVLVTDADAGEEVEVAAESLRENDRLHIWKDGEIEDTFGTETLVQQLNNFLQASGAPGYVGATDFPAGQRRTVILNRLWRARGLGNFDKIGFAEVVAAHLRDKEQVPADVVGAISKVQSLLQAEQQRSGKQPRRVGG